MVTSNLNVHSINVYNAKFRNKTTIIRPVLHLRNDFAAVSLGVEPFGETSHFV